MQFAVKTPEIKSSIIVEKQEGSGQSLLTFEASDELDLSDILIENIPNEINVISIPNVENTSNILTINRTSNDLTVQQKGEISPGRYLFDIQYVDGNLNTITQNFQKDILEQNNSAQIIAPTNSIVASDTPYGNIELFDEGGIEKVELFLKDGFAQVLNFNFDSISEGDLQVVWNETDRVITVSGNGTESLHPNSEHFYFRI